MRKIQHQISYIVNAVMVFKIKIVNYYVIFHYLVAYPHYLLDTHRYHLMVVRRISWSHQWRPPRQPTHLTDPMRAHS